MHNEIRVLCKAWFAVCCSPMQETNGGCQNGLRIISTLGSTTSLCLIICHHHPLLSVPRLEVLRNDNVDAVKGQFITQAIRIAKERDYDWMLYLDANEFLYLRDHDTVLQFVASCGNARSVAINWVLFGSNLKDVAEPHLTMFEAFTRSSAQPNLHVKTFVRPALALRPATPHTFVCQSMDGLDIGNATDGFGCTRKNERCLVEDSTCLTVIYPALVAHFFASGLRDVSTASCHQATRRCSPR